MNPEIQGIIDACMRGTVGRLNDADLRKELTATITHALAGYPNMGERAVICDETNNTEERIAAKEVWADVAVKLKGEKEFTHYPARITV